MNVEALLRKHLESAAERVEVEPPAVAKITGRVRRTRVLLGLTVAAALVLVVAVVGTTGNGSRQAVSSSTSTTPTTAPSVVIPTTTAPPPTTTARSPSATTTAEPRAADNAMIAWTAADAQRDVENFLAALAEGAYEQAAWPLVNNGGAYEGQRSDETAAQYLARVCADDTCDGPYTVVASGPGVIEGPSSQASSTVTVTNIGSGQSAVLTVASFEGQRVVMGLPARAPSAGAVGLVNELFGAAPPERVVVQRFDALEIWENGQPEWVTNWWADDIEQVEQNYGLGAQRVFDLRDPATFTPAECGRLMTQGDSVLMLSQCSSDGWVLTDMATGREIPPPSVSVSGAEDGWPWFTERGTTVLTGEGDAEGNLVTLEANGVDVAGSDYVGLLQLSVDGSKVAYVDHRDPNAYSHFWSPVVVVKDVATGAELGRWTLDGPVLGIEFSGDWVVAWEASTDSQQLASGMPDQVAVDAINITTGAVNRVETGTKVFLPS